MMKPQLKSRASRGQGVFEVIAGMIFLGLMLISIASASIYLYMENVAVTAVREGARMASLSDDVNADEATIKNRVVDILQAAAGQSIPTSAVTVTPPDPAGTYGERQVSVELNYDLPTPLNPGGVFSSFGGSGYVANGEDEGEASPVTVPLAAAATLRYEE